MGHLEITVGYPPRVLSPNRRAMTRGSQFRKSRVSKVVKMEAWTATLAALAQSGITPPDPSKTLLYRVILRPPLGRRRMDDDNALGSLKWARDGIAAGLKVDDRQFRIAGLSWEKRLDPKGSATFVLTWED